MTSKNSFLSTLLVILAIVVLLYGALYGVFSAIDNFKDASDYSDRIEELEESIKEYKGYDDDDLDEMKEDLSEAKSEKTKIIFSGIFSLLEIAMYAGVSLCLIALSKVLKGKAASAAPMNAPIPTEPMRAPQPSYQPPQNRCPNCGRPMEGAFCAYCGARRG